MLDDMLYRLGQDHIVKLINTENDSALKDRIARDLEGVDVDLMAALMRGEGLYQPPTGEVAPPEVVPASFAASKEALTYVRHGEDLLRSGRVAALTVAGGQGSRLGIEAPKGVVGVTPVKSKSLFRLFAEKILALENRFGCTICWFIMTSEENDLQTKAFFKENGYFGLRPVHVHFFVQGMLPSITPEAKFIISEKGRIFMNPDGHGGTFRALKTSGSLDLMKALGVEEIFYFQVDNPLVKVCDPLFLGLHNLSGAHMSSKVVRKSGFEEKVGVITSVNGRTTLMEYSDLDDSLRYATAPDGSMLYWAGNLAIHVIRCDFAEKITAKGACLPFHQARKTIAIQGPDGNSREIAAIKFETFLFDALPMAGKSITLEVMREEEFAPVKNLTGTDSLESSRKIQSDLHASWLKRLGIEVAPGISVEISPLSALDFEELKLKAETLPGRIIEDTYL